VVQRLLALLRWRATEPAIDGSFEMLNSAPSELEVRWTSPTSTVRISVDLISASVTIDPPMAG